MTSSTSLWEILPVESEQSRHAILPIQTFSEHQLEKLPHFEPKKDKKKFIGSSKHDNKLEGDMV